MKYQVLASRALVATLVAAQFVVAPTCSFAGTLYAVDFRVSTSASYGVVQFQVGYGSAPGTFSGLLANPVCTGNASLNALSSSSNDVANTTLRSASIKTPQMDFPAVLVTCQFESTGAAPVASNFTVTVTDWESDTTTTAPTVVISSITAL